MADRVATVVNQGFQPQGSLLSLCEVADELSTPFSNVVRRRLFGRLHREVRWFGPTTSDEPASAIAAIDDFKSLREFVELGIRFGEADVG